MKATAIKTAGWNRSETTKKVVRPFVDPLAADRATDQSVLTTRRGIARIALVAAEVASRFHREGIEQEPMAWMLAPRQMFGGAAAIDACIAREDCMRSILLHGLSLGLDADPAAIDDLFVEDGCGVGQAFRSAERAPRTLSSGDGRRDNVFDFRLPAAAPMRLFTAIVVASDDGSTVQAFHASVATDANEFKGRLHLRIGSAAVDANILEGFDPSNPIVAALVSEVMCDTLALIAAEPESPLAAGLDLTIEQRFSG